MFAAAIATFLAVSICSASYVGNAGFEDGQPGRDDGINGFVIPQWMSIDTPDVALPGGLAVDQPVGGTNPDFVLAPAIPSSPQGGQFVLARNSPFDGLVEGISQTINELMPGRTYHISFYQANGGQQDFRPGSPDQIGPGHWRVSFGEISYDGPTITFQGFGQQHWEKVAFNFVAMGITQQLEFSARGFVGGGAETVGRLAIDGVDIMDVTSQVFGDYNGDGVVDAADYVVWRKESAVPNTNSPADGNLDGDVDEVDYGIWRMNFGTDVFAPSASASDATRAVPEPATVSWVILACATFVGAICRMWLRDSGKRTHNIFAIRAAGVAFAFAISCNSLCVAGNLIDETYGIGAGSFELGTFIDGGGVLSDRGPNYMTLASGDSSTIHGWTVGGPGEGVDWLIEPGYAAQQGTHALDLQHTSRSSIYTVIPTVPGSVYALTFAGATAISYNNTGVVDAGSLSEQPFAVPLSGSLAAQVYEQFSFLFTANGPNTEVRFTSTENDRHYGPAIDDVAVRLYEGHLIGDYNGDGGVDAADYVVWRREFAAPSTNSPADGNLDGDVDDEDYEIWRMNFGTDVLAPGASSGNQYEAAAPEPTTAVLVVIGALAIVFSRRFGSKRNPNGTP